MSINLAYNKLNFKHQITDDNKIAYKSQSPFSHLHHLKMLNLSHNEIQNSFDDFWSNGHEEVDLSYNNIVDFVPVSILKINIQLPITYGIILVLKQNL